MENPETIYDGEAIANMDFKATLPRETALQFGGEYLSNNMITARVLAMLLTRDKEELMKGVDQELFDEIIDQAVEFKKFLAALTEIYEVSLARLQCVGVTIGRRSEVSAAEI